MNHPGNVLGLSRSNCSFEALNDNPINRFEEDSLYYEVTAGYLADDNNLEGTQSNERGYSLSLKRGLSSDYELLDISSPTPVKLARQLSAASTASYDSCVPIDRNAYRNQTLYQDRNCHDSSTVNLLDHNAQFDVQLAEKSSAHSLGVYKEDPFPEKIPIDSLCPSSSRLQTLRPRASTSRVNGSPAIKGSGDHPGLVQAAKNPADVVRVKHIQGIPLTESDIHVLLKDRQKKDNHNLIERRRRFNINDKIRELSYLLPPTSLSNSTDSKRLNKGVILKESVDYIKQLMEELRQLQILKQRYSTLTELNRELLKRLELLESCVGSKQNSTTKTSYTISTTSSQVNERSYSDLLKDISYPLATEASSSIGAAGVVSNDRGEQKPVVRSNRKPEHSADLTSLSDWQKKAPGISNEDVFPMHDQQAPPVSSSIRPSQRIHNDMPQYALQCGSAFQANTTSDDCGSVLCAAQVRKPATNCSDESAMTFPSSHLESGSKRSGGSSYGVAGISYNIQSVVTQCKSGNTVKYISTAVVPSCDVDKSLRLIEDDDYDNRFECISAMHHYNEHLQPFGKRRCTEDRGSVVRADNVKM